jgi:hypothetical protein
VVAVVEQLVAMEVLTLVVMEPMNRADNQLREE